MFQIGRKKRQKRRKFGLALKQFENCARYASCKVHWVTGEDRSMTKRVLLAATVKWPSAARYANGFDAAGCTVAVMAPKGAPAGVSRYVRDYYLYRPLAPISSIRRAIRESDANLIIPCDDRVVNHLLQLYAMEKKQDPHSSIAALIEKSLGSPADYPRLLSRHQSLMALRDAGVRVPDTFPVASEAELETHLATIGFPAVLKADGSWGGDGVIVARNRKEALAAYRKLAVPPSRLRSLVRIVKRRDLHHLLTALAPKRYAVSIQRFVEGTPAASAFAAWKGDVAASIYYDVLAADGSVGPPSVIKRVDCPEINAATQAAARIFGLSGFHGIDFIRDASGAVHAIEINARATQGGTLAFGAGHDLPAGLAAAISEKIAGMRKAIPNDVVVFFPREWIHNPKSAYLKTGHHDVPWDDPAVLAAALIA
jgi:hypothetical protein